MLEEFYKNKKVLITGHTGFKGSWLSKILLNFGADVLGYSLECNTVPSMFKLLDLDNKMNSVIGDIRDLELLKTTILDFKPEIIIHLAAQPLVGEAINNPEETYNTNVIGTINLFEVISLCDSVKSVINVSTTTVYDIKNDKTNYKENDNIKGNNLYSISKSIAERIVEDYKINIFKENDFPRVSTTRAVNVIGGGDFNYSRILPSCLLAWNENKNIELKNPNVHKSFLHVLEVLYGYLLLAMFQYIDKSFEGLYNFSSSQLDNISIVDITNIFCKKINYNISFNITNKNKTKTSLIEFDSSKSRNILNWKSIFTMEERIQLVIDWHKSLLNNEDMNLITDKQIENFFKRIK